MDFHLPHLLAYLFGFGLMMATGATIVRGSTSRRYNDSLAENRQKYGPPTCPRNKFDCDGDGQVCIRQSWKCDGEKDCDNGNDEKHCDVTTTPKPTEPCTNKLKKYPCYKTYGLRVGCYNNYCFRQKQRAWKRWGYFNKWKSERRESCNTHQGCIDMLKERPEDLACYEGGKLESYPCHRGWRYGCYKKKCFRQKFMTSSRWGYFEDRTTKKYVRCKKADDCLQYWLERPNEIPCVKSDLWGSYPCYKGRRYGCGYIQGLRKCWNEDPTTYSMWAYTTYDKSRKKNDQLGDECNKGDHKGCLGLASKKIDSFKEP